jgi:hypothetical protein
MVAFNTQSFDPKVRQAKIGVWSSAMNSVIIRAETR